ncbi:hypothetical protein AHAS_Ahas16G0166300 [Arachis hypogaea]
MDVIWCLVPMDSTQYSKEMKLLACGPMLQARHFEAYNINGYMFRTFINENELKTQNSGVYVSSNRRSYAIMRDNIVVVGSVPYDEKIVNIIELNYSCHFIVVLFKCIWVDTTTSKGIKQDHLGLTSVNFTRPIHTGDREEDEPYILILEAHLVYYVHDKIDKEWNSGLNMLATSDIGDLQLTRDDDIEDPIDDDFENFDDVA